MVPWARKPTSWSLRDSSLEYLDEQPADDLALGLRIGDARRARVRKRCAASTRMTFTPRFCAKVRMTWSPSPSRSRP
jgi:hypothetical protein